MKPLNCRALVLVFAVFAAAVSSVFAQTPAPTAAPVEINTVKFRPVAGGWFEAEVEVQAKPGPAATANRNFVNRVKVTFNLGVISVKAPQGATLPDTYYRASAEAVAIETNGRTSFRFYLPPEIVKRDQVTGPQKFYLVELSVGGQALPLTKDSVPTNFTSSAFVEGFRSKISGEASANDGILLPQYLTPFANGGTNTPTFIRVESAH
jgi:hypothetical protein